MENAPATTANAVNRNALATKTPLAAMQNAVSNQPVMKQILFLVAIAASIAVGGYVLMWSQTPSYQVLFANVAPADSPQIVDAIQQMNVDYKLDPTSGAILVPASEVQALRLKLAAEGLPRASSQGMDMLDKEPGFGTSQFIERARYQRAMEEELSRSVAELNPVRNARVHLAMPKQSVFVRDRKNPTASVIVNLYAGRSLERGQVEAIAHMVASSVPNMTNADVTIVDQRGNLLSQPARDGNVAMSDTQLDYTRKLEQIYISRIEDILSPIVGMNGVRAQVVADVDFTVTEHTNESYNPDLAAVRSEQSREETRTGSSTPMGIPGALSNQPPMTGTAPEVTTTEAGTVPVVPESSTKSTTRNFELDRTISHTRVAPGQVRQLSVAVLVDERHSVDAEGNATSTPLSEAEMNRINALVVDAIGFNQARGDSLNIVNAPFRAPDNLEPLPSQPLWEQPWFWNVAKQLGGALVVLFLIFGVIRPAFRDMTRVPEADNAEPALPETANLTAAEVSKKAGMNQAEIAKLTQGSGQLEDQLTSVRSLIQQDPALVAQVMKNWTSKEA